MLCTSAPATFPPGAPSRSINSVFNPSRAQQMAAATPADPAPKTATSNSVSWFGVWEFSKVLAESWWVRGV
jgi:hypothetical protein